MTPEAVLRTASRHRAGRLMGVQVVGVGSSVPRSWSATKIWPRWATMPSGSCSAPAFCERRHAAAGHGHQRPGRRGRAGGASSTPASIPQDIDLVLLGTYTPDMLMPATACLVQDGSGCAPGHGPAGGLRGLRVRHDHRHAVRGHRLQPAGAGDRRRLQLAGRQPGRQADLSAVRRRGRRGAAGAGRRRPRAAVLRRRVPTARAAALCRPMGGSRLPFSAAPERDRPAIPAHGRPAGLQMGRPHAARDDLRRARRPPT